MDWKPDTRGFVVLAAIVLLIACGAGDDPPARAADAGEELATPAEGPTSAARQSPTAWRVDLVVDQPEDARGRAASVRRPQCDLVRPDGCGRPRNGRELQRRVSQAPAEGRFDGRRRRGDRA